MGTILASCGDAAYDHEGYAAQVLDDGSLTTTCNTQTKRRMVNEVVAARGCGWTGTTRYPTTTQLFDEQAEELALGESEHAHARPLLARLQRAELARLRALLRSLATQVPDPGDAPREVADRIAHLLDGWTGPMPSPADCTTRPTTRAEAEGGRR